MRESKVALRIGHTAHSAEFLGHSVYLGAAFMEGHGLYGYAAAALLLILIVAKLFAAANE